MEQRRKRPLEQERDIRFHVKGQDGVKVFFTVARTTRMLKVLQKYCEKRNVEYKTIQFLYNGNRFSVKKSPEELGIENNDEIEAMMHQSGGGTIVSEDGSHYI